MFLFVLGTSQTFRDWPGDFLDLFRQGRPSLACPCRGQDSSGPRWSIWQAPGCAPNVPAPLPRTQMAP